MNEYVDAGFDSHWSEALAEATGVKRAPFSPVVRTSGTTIYTAGQTYPIIGSSDSPAPADASMAEQTLACLENVDMLVRAAGGTREDIVKVTIFNTRMAEQSIVNALYTEFFGDHRPARSHIEVTRLADPDLLIEIEAIAVIDR